MSIKDIMLFFVLGFICTQSYSCHGMMSWLLGSADKKSPCKNRLLRDIERVNQFDDLDDAVQKALTVNRSDGFYDQCMATAKKTAKRILQREPHMLEEKYTQLLNGRDDATEDENHRFYLDEWARLQLYKQVYGVQESEVYEVEDFLMKLSPLSYRLWNKGLEGHSDVGFLEEC